MAVLWPTHRVKAAQAKALRRRLRKQSSAADKAAHQEAKRRSVAGP